MGRVNDCQNHTPGYNVHPFGDDDYPQRNIDKDKGDDDYPQRNMDKGKGDNDHPLGDNAYPPRDNNHPLGDGDRIHG